MLNKRLIDTIKLRLSEVWEVLKRINPVTKDRIYEGILFIKKSWKSIAVLLPVFLVLYYTVGSLATNNIDKSLIAMTKPSSKGLTVVSASADLIEREVDDKMWTANLPIIFPGYVLDNMPQFQLGIINSLKTVTGVLAHNYESENLNKAAELLKYPGNVWLLSKTDNLSLAPSSGAQYRKARKELLKFNDNLIVPKADSSQILINVLDVINRNLSSVTADLEQQIREHSTDFVDTQADNAFYYAQGRLYGYYVVIKALSEDFKPQILEAEQYENITILNKNLENGFLLDPWIVRNGKPDAVFAANHLFILNYYVAKAAYQLSEIINALQKANN